MVHPISRREFLAQASAGTCLAAGSSPATGADQDHAADKNKALIAITLDLEMSRNFPTWDKTHWDYEKGNLDSDTKKYALEAARRVKEKGGKIHFFVVGRVFEQENVAWLQEIVRAGHPVGNHTYDHVHMKAAKPEDLQFRFQRAPWLIQGKKISDVIAENIRLTTLALKARIGIDPAGFRTPGGFPNGLSDRADLQRLLQGQGFKWVSSKYPAHPIGKPKEELGETVLAGIVKAQDEAQPFVYPSGLIEVPMSPISDIGAFRTGRWQLESFLKAIRASVEWVIEKHAVFDFLGHPSCLLATDPKFQAVDLICDMVQKVGNRAALVDLETIARRAKLNSARS